MRGIEKIRGLTPNSQQGFTFLGLMIVVAVMGAALAGMGTYFSHEAQREKERELLFVGQQFRAAIESYYRRSPGAPAYPKTLADLVEDKRFPMPQHHLRRVYADPITGQADWVAIEAPGGAGIMGVHSPSQAAPIKRGNFDAQETVFEDARRYSDWQFFYTPPQAPGNPAPKG
jgi:type II secretory pathway pseudopilin PulG